MRRPESPSPSRRQLLGLPAAAALLGAPGSVALAGDGNPPLRIALLKFGTVNWTMDVLRRAGLEQRHDIRLLQTGYATGQAAKVALLAGDADVIVADWIWAARQRAEGNDLRFLPYSSAAGGLMVPADSGIRQLGDLAGRRLGIAGGPLDKSWLALQAVARRDHNIDLNRDAVPAYGAPPLISQQLKQGRLDAVLTFWHFAARLEAAGHRRMLSARSLFEALGAKHRFPIIGFVFRHHWALTHPDTARGFANAVRDALDLMRHDDAVWTPLAPKLRAPDRATAEILKRDFRDGSLPLADSGWQDTMIALHATLARLGGERLVGAATRLDPVLFWSPDR